MLRRRKYIPQPLVFVHGTNPFRPSIDESRVQVQGSLELDLVNCSPCKTLVRAAKGRNTARSTVNFIQATGILESRIPSLISIRLSICKGTNIKGNMMLESNLCLIKLQE